MLLPFIRVRAYVLASILPNGVRQISQTILVGLGEIG